MCVQKLTNGGGNEKEPHCPFSTNGKQLAARSQPAEKFYMHISYRRIPLAQEKYHSLTCSDNSELCKVGVNCCLFMCGYVVNKKLGVDAVSTCICTLYACVNVFGMLTEFVGQLYDR